jgi:hypothetical protein
MRIFITSLKEVCANSVNLCGNAAVSLLFWLIISFRGRFLPPQPFMKAAAFYFVISWVVLIYFRYYFHPTVWPFWMQLTGAILYAILFCLWLIVYFDKTFGVELALHMTTVTGACMIIMRNPNA